MCAATNPLKVSDLIDKYDSQVIPYLSNLGVRSLAEAQVLFVDSGHTNALDADDAAVHGHSFESPLATLDYAVGLLTASEGGIILLAPGHNENIADGDTIDNDINGVTVIGLGTGTLRPRFDFDAATSTIDIGANNITFVNLTFMPGAADVLIGVDVEAGMTNFRMVDCECLEGEAAGDEFLAAVELKAGCHNTTIENNVFRAGWSSNPDDAISLKGASNNVTIRNNRASGPYGDGAGVTAAISNSSGVCLDLLIENNILKVKDGESGIEVIATTPAVIRKNLIVSTGLAVDSMIVATIGELDQNVGVTTDGTSGEFILGGTVSPEIVQYNLDHLAKTTTGVVADADISGIIADNSILAHIMTAGADAADFNASTDSLEAISVAVAAISSPTDVTGAVPNTPTAKSLQDILSKLDGANTFDNTTDSLEAIADLLLTGTPLTGLQLDHLCAVTTSVAADSDLETYCVAGSLMSHVMSVGADVTTFQASTDSLEAIGTAVAALSWDTAVSQTPTARSMQDILEKDNSGSFDDATDSLEAIRDHIDGTTVLGGIQLDHLAKTASAGTNYPTEITTDSILAMMMAAAGNPNTFNKTTDSLEAISVALAAGTGCTTAIDADQLDHLAGADTTVAADGDLTTYCADGSILAHIMSATANTSTYKATTDSLEAIAVALAAGTGATAALDADLLGELMAGTTGIAADASLILHTVSGSLMAHIMSATAVGSTYQCSTDSLEAIAVALAAGTGCSTALDGDQLDHLVGTTTGVAAGSDLETYCVAGSLMSHIASVGADITTFDCQTDSLEVLSDKLGAYTFDGGADDEDTVMAHLDLILADTSVIDVAAPRLITATTTNWDILATNAMFTVSGLVRAKIWGEVLVQVKGVAMNLKVVSTPTAPGGAIDVTAVLDCNADAAGTVYKLATTLGGAMVEVTGGVSADDGIDVILPPGVVTLGSAADEDGGGSIQWFCQYEPLESGAVVTAT